MGKATRWLRGLIGMKKGKENVAENTISSGRKEKNRWSFTKSGKDSGGVREVPAVDTAWLRSLVADSDKEQSKHAIAVAAATSAAADAAVAAAQAAVAVVRLTSRSREALFCGEREKIAALKIQTVFRGYLARKALRALRGLVKLQALVKGYLVRKRAAKTLQSMQALIRAQAGVRMRARVMMNNESRFQPEMRSRKSTESRGELHYSRRFPPSFDPSPNASDESPKIVEIDMGRPKSRSRRMSTCFSEYSRDQFYQAITSPILRPVPKKYDLDHHYLQGSDWGFVPEECKFATAQNTPRFGCSGLVDGPVTPVAKSVCGDSFLRPYSNLPSYMADTQSFKAKVRSHSAPKQRPVAGSNRRLSSSDMVASRTSFSGVRMNRSCDRVEEYRAC